MSCLFVALAKQPGEKRTHQEIRSLICEYLTNDNELGKVGKASDVVMWESGMNLAKYVAKMRFTSTWGGAIEISAWCNLTQSKIHVYDVRKSQSLITEFIPSGDKNNGKTLRLQWSGGHYEPL